MSSSNPFPSLENNIQLLRTSLNAIYGRTSNIIEHRAAPSHQQTSYEPSKEDLDALESMKTQFHAVCDELYLNLQNAKKVLLRDYHENFKDLINENKQREEIIAEKMITQNKKIASLGKILEVDKLPAQDASSKIVKMDES
ncbi:16710_t:CDS:2 [Funneliformis caledonium]|uniref:16710_t:CDS:1 n=1 Tax=Funneliformis caledonium TaxID=1117310 RepID=A0A9N8YZJ1_9GLOM|nr:16710_t:CDS:2 [Funneliformis caledonium]